MTAGDSRDSQQRERFFPFKPEEHLLHKGRDDWYRNTIFHPQEQVRKLNNTPSAQQRQICTTEFQGSECCADDVISFHYVSEEQMYVFDYLIYRVGQKMAITKFLEALNGRWQSR